MISSQLLSGSLIYGLGSVVNRLATLLMLPVFTTYLSPSEYGVVGLLNTVGMLLTPVLSFGLGTSIGVCYFSSDDEVTRERIIRSAMFILVLSGVFLVIGSAVLGQEISVAVFTSEGYGFHVFVTMLGVALGLIVIPLQLRLQFSNRPVPYVVSSLIGVSANLLCGSIAVIKFEMGAAGLLIGAAAGQFVTLIICASYCVVLPRMSDLFSTPSRQLLVLGFPMIPSFFLLFYLQNAVRWPLEWQLGLHHVGLYIVGNSFGAAMSIVTGSVTAAWLPHALKYGSNWNIGRQQLAREFNYYYAWAGFLVLTFFVMAQPVMSIFAADGYFEAWKVIGMSALTQFLLSLFSMVLPPVYLAKQVQKVNISQFFSVLVLTALIPGLLIYGIFGAALAVVCGSIVLLMTTFWLVVLPIKNYAPIPCDFMILAKISAVLIFGASATFFIEIEEFLKFFVAAFSILFLTGIFIARYFPIKIAKFGFNH